MAFERRWCGSTFKVQGSMKNRCIETLEFLNGAAI